MGDKAVVHGMRKLAREKSREAAGKLGKSVADDVGRIQETSEERKVIA